MTCTTSICIMIVGVVVAAVLLIGGPLLWARQQYKKYDVPISQSVLPPICSNTTPPIPNIIKPRLPCHVPVPSTTYQKPPPSPRPVSMYES